MQFICLDIFSGLAYCAAITLRDQQKQYSRVMINYVTVAEWNPCGFINYHDLQSTTVIPTGILKLFKKKK